MTLPMDCQLDQEADEITCYASLPKEYRPNKTAILLRKAAQHIREQAIALALLRELNDALVIPGWLQPRVDALLDRAEEKT